MNADHEALRLALGAYILGTLAPAEAERVRAHLADCDECRAEHAELAGLPALLATVTAVEAEGRPVPVGDEDPADRLVRRAAEGAGDSPQPPPGAMAPRAPEAGLLDRMLQQAAAGRRSTGL
ncbi:zf-HC2 domain-containing protein, partial [Streptomyces sp. NPDC003233]